MNAVEAIKKAMEALRKVEDEALQEVLDRMEPEVEALDGCFSGGNNQPPECDAP